ncbi:MAG: hypothetical protein SGBAC_003838, partial [Bacillariaceae sp.]
SKMDYGKIEVGKKYDCGEMEVEKKTDYGDIEIEKKIDYGEIEVGKKYGLEDSGDLLVEKNVDYGEIEVDKKTDYGEIAVEKKTDSDLDYGDMEVEKKTDYGQIEVAMKTDYGGIEAGKKCSYDLEDYGIMAVEKKTDDYGQVEVDKKTDYGAMEMEKKHDYGQIAVEKKTGHGEIKVEKKEKKYEDVGNTTHDEDGKNSARNSGRAIVGETDTKDSKSPKKALFKSLSPKSGLMQRLTPSRQKRALAKIRTISQKNKFLDPPLNDDEDTTVKDTAGSTSDSHTSPDISDSPKKVVDDNDDDEFDELNVSENSDTLSSLRHIGTRRHVGMAGLYASGHSRPGPKSRPSLAGPPLRPTLNRPTLNRPSMATSMRINSGRGGGRGLPNRRNLRRVQSQRRKAPEMKVNNFQDYLKMQQMQSVRRFDNAWTMEDDDDSEEENAIDVPSKSIFASRPTLEQSGEFSMSFRASTRPSDNRRVASTQGITHLAQSADWFEFLENVNDDDDNAKQDLDDFDIDNDLDVRTPFYCRPCQRQRWAAKQILPHVNWGDLFFDLFFVSMAANLGNMVVGVLQQPANAFRGTIYFVGCFGPLFNSWENKTKYQARYTVNDHAHQMFDIARIFVIGFAVLHIKSLDLFADPKSIEMGVFTFSLSVDSILSFFVNMELFLHAKGDRRAIRTTTKRKMIQNAFFETPYLVATILAAIFFWTDVATETEAKENSLWRLADLPLTLCCASYLLRICTQIGIMQYHNRSKKVIDFQNRFVPHNIEFLIQRYGEWVMLMIGENVLALLIVETIESVDYYIVTTIGMFIVL